MPWRRGQVSVEYMVLIASLMLGIVFLGYYELENTRVNLQVNTAQDAVDSLARAADTVYSMGPCSKTYAQITIPQSSRAAAGYYQNGYMTRIQGDFGAGQRDIISLTKAKIQGYIPAIDRGYRMPVIYTCSGVIQIGQDFKLSKDEIRKSISAGGTSTEALTLTNNRDITISAINVYKLGVAGGWTTVTGLASGIASTGVDSFDVGITVPGGTAAGVYTGWVMINGTSAITELHEVVTVP